MYPYLFHLHVKISLWKRFVHHPVEHIHVLQGVHVYPHYVFFHWDISVICLTIISKLTVTVFVSLYFHRFWPKWLNFFRPFQKHFDPWPKKTQSPIWETPFHETDSFLPIIFDLWLSVAGKVRGRLEERASHFKLAMKKFKDDHPDYFASKPGEQRTPRVILRSATPGYGPM